MGVGKLIKLGQREQMKNNNVDLQTCVSLTVISYHLLLTNTGGLTTFIHIHHHHTVPHQHHHYLLKRNNVIVKIKFC